MLGQSLDSSIEKGVFAVAATAAATNRSAQNQLRQPGLLPLIRGQNVGETIRSAWQTENKTEALFCSSEASLSGDVPFALRSFSGEKYSLPLKMLLVVTQPR